MIEYLGGRDTNEHSLCQLFGFGHSIEALQLSRLQKVILNLIPGELEAEIESSTTSVNTRDSKGATALWWAAFLGKLTLVQLLLKHNADPNIADVTGRTPISFAYTLAYACLILLLNHGADSNASDNFGFTPLHNLTGCCLDPRFVDVLVTNNARLNMRNMYGWTPLHHSAYNNNSVLITCFLEYGAEPNAQSGVGHTPLSLTILKNSHQCLKTLLMAGADCSIIRKDNSSILHVAAAYADEATLRILTSFKISGIDCDMRNKSGHTPWDELLDYRVGHDSGP